MIPWGALGDVTFEVLQSPFEMNVKESVPYAKHRLINTKPRLQRTGGSHQVMSLKVRWHRAVHPNIELDLRSLADSMRQGEVLDFSLGAGPTGIYAGQYVLTDLEHRPEQHDGRGRLVSVEATLNLEEWTPDPVLKIVAIPKPPPAVKKNTAPDSQVKTSKKTTPSGVPVTTLETPKTPKVDPRSGK